MDIDQYTLEDLLTAAIKSEAEAKEIYGDLADRVTNAFLKDRLRFLAGEEEKHRAFLEKLRHKTFPDIGVALPEKSPVPMPEIKVWDENMPISDVLTSAMKAEQAAADFYTSLAGRFDDAETKNTLIYLSKMEAGHYRILEEERKNTELFEDYDTI
ncbi:MAG: ferritin family protein [Thermoplasmata archaeon]|nr:ferritin family protein [Thermoplasmata archaeon]